MKVKRLPPSTKEGEGRKGRYASCAPKFILDGLCHLCSKVDDNTQKGFVECSCGHILLLEFLTCKTVI